MKLPVLSFATFLLVLDGATLAGAATLGNVNSDQTISRGQRDDRGRNDSRNNGGRNNGHQNGGSRHDDRSGRDDRNDHRNPGHGGGRSPGYGGNPPGHGGGYPPGRGPTPVPVPAPRPTPRPPVDRVYESAVSFHGVSRRAGGEWVRVQLAYPVALESVSINIHRAGLRVYEAIAHSAHGRPQYIQGLAMPRTQFRRAQSQHLGYMGLVTAVDLRVEGMGGNVDIDVVLRSFERPARGYPQRF